MSFKYFNAPVSARYAKEEEKVIVQALSDLGLQRLYQVHMSNYVGDNQKGMKGHASMFNGFEASADYHADSELILEKMLTYACEMEGYPSDSESLKSYGYRKDHPVPKKFFGILDQALPTVLASTVNYAFMNVAEMRYGGWDDTMHFTVPSKDIFHVNALGLGNKHGATQRVYSQDIILNPTMKEVSVSLDWFQIVAKRYDIGDFMYRVGVSFATDISKLAYAKIDSAYASLPTKLQQAGFTDAKWIEVGQATKLVNANLPVYAMGSLTAFQSIIPSNDYLKMELGAEFAGVGYLGRYKGINMVEIPQVLVPNTANTTLTFGLDDTRIYFFSMGDKPVKIGFLGQAITSTTDMTDSGDGQMVVTVKQMYDATIASSNRFGIMDLG